MNTQSSPTPTNRAPQEPQSFIPGARRPDKRVRLRRRRKWPAAVAVICVAVVGIVLGVNALRARQAEAQRNEVLAPYQSVYLTNVYMDGLSAGRLVPGPDL